MELYKFRDERLKKFTDFLLSIRPIKMSALEGVFRKSLLHLRQKEIDQAYRVNILDVLIETLFSASSTMAFRSCRRLISFFKEEEYSKEEAENRRAPNFPVGEVTLKDCSFAWCKRDQKVDSPGLDGVNLLVESGSLVGVVGTVGSGKSSLLSAIVGDMRHLSGSVSLNGSIAVVSQAPQILNMTVRDNITFGRKFEDLHYSKVVEACQLSRDINRMAAGDLTEAGDKGEMLSGGQKQRVALARAVYSRSDIYLLDDPTSSQDARVAQNIMRRVLGHDGILGNKTRILVTNNSRLPLKPNQWVLMHKKRGITFRDLKDLKNHPCAPVELFEKPTSKHLPERTSSVNVGIALKTLLRSEIGTGDIFKLDNPCCRHRILRLCLEFELGGTLTLRRGHANRLGAFFYRKYINVITGIRVRFNVSHLLDSAHSRRELIAHRFGY
ncbi:hypothetical protein HPB52_013575 [Rhipicephalus sanguineus]|uniref:ABC transporter domain-containing protein n=1 Tax=Rhipicephalus sanguineus TaxID=34632 RepID=A0A9D4PMD8_RHISA|nr:hypothetical protein HPB52_013575 [Rhipicephalus sanguineus]